MKNGNFLKKVKNILWAWKNKEKEIKITVKKHVVWVIGKENSKKFKELMEKRVS